MLTLIAYAFLFVLFIVGLVVTQKRNAAHDCVAREQDKHIEVACEVAKKKYKQRFGTNPQELEQEEFKVIPLATKKHSSG